MQVQRGGDGTELIFILFPTHVVKVKANHLFGIGHLRNHLAELLQMDFVLVSLRVHSHHFVTLFKNVLQALLAEEGGLR